MIKSFLAYFLTCSNLSSTTSTTTNNDVVIKFTYGESNKLSNFDLNTNVMNNIDYIEQNKEIVLPEYLDTKIFVDYSNVLISNNQISTPILFYNAFKYFNETVKINLQSGYKMNFYKADATIIGKGISDQGNVSANLSLPGNYFMDYLNYLEKITRDESIAFDDKVGFVISMNYINPLFYSSTFNYLSVFGEMSKIIDSNYFLKLNNNFVSFEFKLTTSIRFY